MAKRNIRTRARTAVKKAIKREVTKQVTAEKVKMRKKTVQVGKAIVRAQKTRNRSILRAIKKVAN